MPTQTGIVLIHGAGHAADCWDFTVAELARQAPGVPVLAVDLPGRGTEPGDLATLTIEKCVQSVIRQIDDAGMDRVMLVSHSQAGITMPVVAERLGAARTARLIFLSSVIPPNGSAAVDTLNPPLRFITRRAAVRRPVRKAVGRGVASMFFGNGMTAEQREFTVGHQYAESAGLVLERVDRTLPAVPTTWILLTADRLLKPRQQREFIANLGGVDEVVPLDTCHDAMISEPAALAELLAARVGDGSPTAP
ncbi:alpha/beta fold hydrolase [Subtercola endophyticus]|uniref:alpha/beta fold hydrolase n=1 Tax=Subtercola endophyticus TaxID=2895559 RepID=UPI001E42B763|nr:alpha/beta hydrolase [Subtercola endophyticus]UFS60606.1 alpha/beta fold hydrolase [Subtercola endophyticus]